MVVGGRDTWRCLFISESRHFFTLKMDCLDALSSSDLQTYDNATENDI